MENFKIIASGHACTELVVETNHLRKYLGENGLHEITNEQNADVILVSTCSFNQEFEDEAYANLSKAVSSKKDGTKIIVSGCFPAIAPERFNSFKNVVAIPPLNMEKIEDIIPSRVAMKDVLPNTVNLNDYLKDEKFIKAIKLKTFSLKLKYWECLAT